jgi:hypothetical protein
MFVGFCQIEETGSFGAERSLIDRMVGVAFDVDDLSGRLIRTADKTTTDGTVTASRYRLFGDFNSIHFAQLFRVCPSRFQVEPQG